MPDTRKLRIAYAESLGYEKQGEMNAWLAPGKEQRVCFYDELPPLPPSFMPKMKDPISYTRTSDHDVAMMDGRGVTIYVRPDATIADLIRAGAKSIDIVSPDAPPVPHHYRSGGGRSRWRINDLSKGFTVVGPDSTVKVPGEVCEFVAKMPDVARMRQIYGDGNLSTRIVETIIDCMDVEKLTQEVVDRFAAKMIKKPRSE